MRRNELNIPPQVGMYVAEAYAVGVELDIKKVTQQFPADYGSNVFDNRRSLPNVVDGNFYYLKLLPGKDMFIMILTMKNSGVGDYRFERCLMLGKNTDDHRRELAMLKLKYG